MTYEETLRRFLDDLNDEWENGSYLFPKKFNLYVYENEVVDFFPTRMNKLKVEIKGSEVIITEQLLLDVEIGSGYWEFQKERLMKKILNSLLGFGLLACEEQIKKTQG